jgi:hypothetical protein
MKKRPHHNTSKKSKTTKTMSIVPTTSKPAKTQIPIPKHPVPPLPEATQVIFKPSQVDRIQAEYKTRKMLERQYVITFLLIVMIIIAIIANTLLIKLI